MVTFGFIGCGNMGGALVKAVANAGFDGDIMLADLDENKIQAITSEIEAKPGTAKEIAEECKYIFIGVKPQVISKCFDEIRDTLSSRGTPCVIVSMAAGVAISDIISLSGNKKVIRIMPNMPVAVGQGVVLAASENVSDDEKAGFEEAMSKSGVFDWLDEKYIDAASALSGCGPAFVYMFIEALSDGAVACGLPRDKAMLYAAGTLLGSSQMVMESGKHPGKLKDEVCSPGGSTIAGVRALEEGSFRASAMDAVIAAYEKTKQLGK